MSDEIEITINENSSVPKYKQIADCIINGMAKGLIKSGQRLPSINNMSEDYYLSRDTVEKAYKTLRERKIIIAVRGKGYYTTDIVIENKLNILFMLNKPSTYKMEIYDSFINEIGANGVVSMFLYYCDENLFVNELEKKIGAFDYYVIMPHFRDEVSGHISYTEKIIDVLNKIPKQKLIFIDNDKPPLQGDFGSVFQDFNNDIFHALEEGWEKIRKYKKIIMVYPEKAHYPYPRRILLGFKQFCNHHHLNFEIIDEIFEDMELEKHQIYITLRERDLVNLIRQIRSKKLILGKDLGVISYNETPLKDLLGITVISTDFKMMGKTAAAMILEKKIIKKKNNFIYIKRKSI